jgi:methionine--tRNA ligase beta chain
MDKITFEDFKKVEIRIGKILECEKVPETDKLLKLQVDFGSEVGKRQIVSGIAESFTPEELVGKSLPFIINLEFRKFKGEESQGMLMAIDAEDKTVLLQPSAAVAPGTEVV